MPPKKRKAVDTALESQSDKRVTRSSTSKDAVTRPEPAKAATTKSKASNTASKPSKAKTPKKEETTSSTAKQPRKKNQTTTGAKNPKDKSTKAQTDSQAQTPANPPSTFTTLTITSDLVKTPIQCHSYSAPSTSPTLIFTHGAGGDCSASAVTNFCTGYSSTYPILAFNGSMNLSSRVKSFHACIAHLSSSSSSRLLLGGRSMGARAAVMAASETSSAKDIRLVLASYPLQGPKDVRDQILLDLPGSVRVLFVIGERDAMCPLEMLEGVRGKMKAVNQLVVVRGADHGMHVRPAKGEREVGEEVGRVVAEWVGGKVGDDVLYVGAEDG